MKKNVVTFAAIALVIILAVIAFLANNSWQANKTLDVLDRIGSAPAVKLEYIKTKASVIDTSQGLSNIRDGVAALCIVPLDGTMEGEWTYRFTFYPNEICPNDDEIEVLFGESSMSIDGVRYIPGDDTSYSTIFEWVQVTYNYFS